MSPSTPHVPLERVRQAVMRAVAETSLRKVAKAIGMSTMGLSHFVNKEGEPYRPTVKKLVAWYVRDAAERHGLDADTASAALALLLDGIPDARFLEVRSKLRDQIRAAYKENGVPPPEWLEKIVP